MPVQFNIPFIPQTAISDQILQALKQGYEERMRGQELEQRKVEETRRQQQADAQINLESARQRLIEAQEKRAVAHDPISMAQAQAQLDLTKFQLKDAEDKAKFFQTDQLPLAPGESGFDLFAKAQRQKIEEGGKLSPAEEAEFNAAVSVSKQKRDVTMMHTVAKDIRTARAKPPIRPNELELIRRANAGDPEALSTLDALRTSRLELVRERGAAFRRFNVFDPGEGRIVSLTSEEIGVGQAEGRTLIPAGTVPATQLLQTQRAAMAIPKAVERVRQHLKAWDNPTDRAVFARVIRESPTGEVDRKTWFGNVLDASLAGGLSDEGRKAVIALRALNESLGSLRVVAALPATIGSMATTAALAPGPTSPNSKFAGEQLDLILQLVEQETNVPFITGKGAGKKQEAGGLKIIRDKDGRIVGIE